VRGDVDEAGAGEQRLGLGPGQQRPPRPAVQLEPGAAGVGHPLVLVGQADRVTDISEDGRPLPTVLLTGTAGAGKSIVAKEIHELLRRAGRPNAMIDLDALGRTFPEVDPPFNSRFVVANLRALWPAYRALALDHLVLARAVLSADELDDYRRSLPGIDLRTVRLEAPPDEIRARLAQREPGVAQSFLLRVAPEMARTMAAQALEDLVVANGAERSVTQVAVEILERLGWPVPEA
jgi:chloramphenicol 3-O-phosphotransferase